MLSDIVVREHNRTLQDLKAKLAEYGKCAVIRPTGWGKTVMISNFARGYKSVLYLYPFESVKMSSENSAVYSENVQIGRIRYMTFAKSARLTDEELFKLHNKFDLIIIDEMHKMSDTNKSTLTIKTIIRFNSNAHLIGATATPVRMDAYDVIEDMFDGVMVYHYDLHDAIKDGVLKKPTYCLCSYDLATDLKEAAIGAGENIEGIRVKEVLKAKLIEASRIFNMEKVIGDTCRKYINTDYMKFICFFSDVKSLKENGKNVYKWFSGAFPGYIVDTLVIHSKTKEEKLNIHKLATLEKRKDKIDLIFAVDMLNMGYHVDDLSGIVMYRGTSSNIIFAQQLGRCLSSSSDTNCIVFDIVDNITRRAVYELKKQKRSEGLGKVYETEITAEDLNAVGLMLTYKEFLLKTVAEVRQVRSRQAYYGWLRRFCLMNKITFPCTYKEFSKHLYEDRNAYLSFLKGYEEIMLRHIPITEKELMEGVFPISLYAELNKVTLKDILYSLGV